MSQCDERGNEWYNHEYTYDCSISPLCLRVFFSFALNCGSS